jgi:hypothetical protein
VRDSAGAPLADVDLMLGHDSANSANSTTWISTRTAADGSYAIEGVDPRSYTLFVGRGLGTSLSIVGTLDVPLAAEIRHDVTLRGGSIQGRVLGIDGAPARGAWVIFLRGPKDDFASTRSASSPTSTRSQRTICARARPPSASTGSTWPPRRAT